MKRIASFITLVLIVAALALPAGPAKADIFAGAVHCEWQVPSWPEPNGNGGGCVDGLLAASAGLDGAGEGVVCLPTACTFEAAVHSYSAPCRSDVFIPPLVETASGSLHVYAMGPFPGYLTSSFSWLRVGLTAVLLYPETAGVAAYVPHPPYGTCGAPLPLVADVVGSVASAP